MEITLDMAILWMKCVLHLDDVIPVKCTKVHVKDVEIGKKIIVVDV